MKEFLDPLVPLIAKQDPEYILSYLERCIEFALNEGDTYNTMRDVQSHLTDIRMAREELGREAESK